MTTPLITRSELQLLYNRAKRELTDGRRPAVPVRAPESLTAKEVSLCSGVAHALGLNNLADRLHVMFSHMVRAKGAGRGTFPQSPRSVHRPMDYEIPSEGRRIGQMKHLEA